MFSRSSTRVIESVAKQRNPNYLFSGFRSLKSYENPNATKAKEETSTTTEAVVEELPQGLLKYRSEETQYIVERTSHDLFDCGLLSKDDFRKIFFRVLDAKPVCNLADLVSGNYHCEEADGNLTLDKLLGKMQTLASGLDGLHSQGVIHGALNPQNVLIFRRHLSNHEYYSNQTYFYVKFIDICCDSRGWKAPEQLLYGSQTRAGDVFTLGCLFFYCLTGGGHPFGESLHLRDQNIIQNNVDLSRLKDFPEAVHLISHLLNPEPELRPEAEKVSSHKLFSSRDDRLRDLSIISRVLQGGYGSTTGICIDHIDILEALKRIAPAIRDANWCRKFNRSVDILDSSPFHRTGMSDDEFGNASEKYDQFISEFLGPRRHSVTSGLYARLLTDTAELMQDYRQRYMDWI